MTALIIGLIAALGIGGGIAVANHGGSHSGGGSAIIEPASPAQIELEKVLNEKHDSAESPAYNKTLQSKMASVGGVYAEQWEENGWDSAPSSTPSAVAARSMHRAPSSGQFDLDHSIYDRPENDLAGDILVGDADDGSPIIALKLNAGEGFAIGTIDENHQNWEPIFTISQANKDEGASSYIYKNQGELNENTLNSEIRLGAPAVGLTTADFCIWSYSLDNADGSQNFFIFDDRFSYVNGFRNDNINMEGVAFVQSGSLLEDNILTGKITLQLNLAENTLTGNVIVPEDTTFNLSDSDIQGSINGSIVNFKGLGTPEEGFKLPTKEGEMRGGVGKLLVGTDGLLEMVGNLGPQLKLPTWDQFKERMSKSKFDVSDDLMQQYNKDFPIFIENFVAQHGNKDEFWSALREVYEYGKVDYTFGAKEVK